jgi:hypothetical protein
MVQLHLDIECSLLQRSLLKKADYLSSSHNGIREDAIQLAMSCQSMQRQQHQTRSQPQQEGKKKTRTAFYEYLTT